MTDSVIPVLFLSFFALTIDIRLNLCNNNVNGIIDNNELQKATRARRIENIQSWLLAWRDS